MFPAASPGSNIPHRCNSTKHRIISPKLPTPHPALSELQNLANEGSEVGREAGPGDALVAVVPSERKQPEEGGRGDDLGGVASPCSASSSSSSSSPPQMQRAATIALSNGNGFYGDQRGGLAALIVMTTAAPVGRGCGEEPNAELGSTHLSLTHAGGRLVLSPVPPKQDTPSPPSSASPQSPAPSNQGVATLSLTLLPSPVIGGLLLTDTPGTLLHPNPTSPSPSLLPFDPDSFLNSPKQGQTYGGPALTPHSVSASSSPSLSPSTSPQPLSLVLSLSPTSPPSSLSSLSSETERKSIPRRPSSLLSLSFSPTRTTPALLPLCLESSLGLDSLSSPLSVPPSDDRAPPTGFAAHLLTNPLSPATQITPSLEVLPTNQLPPEGEKAESQHPCILESHSMCIQPLNLTPATPPNASPVQVKEEQSPPTHAHFESEVTPMDTTHCGHIDGEEAGLTFDSAFPDLISELITEEPISHPPTLAPPIYPIRYMVPPQPTPSTSFLPFPLLTNSGGNPAETQRLANITDFSPEWSYPEVRIFTPLL